MSASRAAINARTTPTLRSPRTRATAIKDIAAILKRIGKARLNRYTRTAMGDYFRDPEINQLIHDLNRSEESESIDLGPEIAEEAASRLLTLLQQMQKLRATDVLLVSGNAPAFRIGGELVRHDLEALGSAEIHRLFIPYLNERLRARLAADGSVDFSVGIDSPGSAQRFRLRVNLHRQRGELAAAIRGLPAEIPTLQQLRLPSQLSELVKPARGLVLVCGPTGSGKSSTLAALVGEINRVAARHVLTIEDPIEYEHRNQKSLIEQIEIGRDAPDFATALRAALRQDPDVILVGEMRDLETISIALTAAETGHLVLSTLHTADSAQAVHRIIDVFPASQQGQVRQQLALTLGAILCQQLVPTRDGRSRLPAIELLLANYAIRNHIRREKLQSLYSEITLGKRHGMITMEESLAALVRDGAVAADEARVRANRPEELEPMMTS